MNTDIDGSPLLLLLSKKEAQQVMALLEHPNIGITTDTAKLYQKVSKFLEECDGDGPGSTTIPEA